MSDQTQTERLENAHDQIRALRLENDRLRRALHKALSFIQDVGTEDPEDIEAMATIERLSGELTSVLEGNK